MLQLKGKTNGPGFVDGVRVSRVSVCLLSFLFSFLGLGAIYLFSGDRLAYLYETQSAGFYGLLRSLGTGIPFPAMSERDGLTFLSFAFNPLNRLYALFPFSATLRGVLFANAVRCGAASAAFSFFLKLRKTGDAPSVLFGILYALSSYSLVGQLTGAAPDVVILLPLLLAGVEQISSRRGFALFSLSLGFAGITSFRAVFGLFVFSFLWLLAIRITKSGKIGKSLAFDLLLLVLSIPAAILISAPVLFPSFDRLILDFEELHFTQNYDLVDFFAKMLPATYDGLHDNHFPYLFIGIAPLLLLPVYFLSGRVDKREKICFGALLFVLYFTFSINVLSAFWDLFALADGINFTLAAVFPALFLSMAARAYGQMDKRSEKTIAVTALLLAALVALLQRMGLTYDSVNGTSTVKVSYFSEVNTVWIALFFLAVGCGVLLLVIRRRESGKGGSVSRISRFSLVLMLLFVLDAALSGGAFAGVIVKKEEHSAALDNHSYASAYYSAYATGLFEGAEQRTLYRVEKFDSVTPSDAAWLGISSASELPENVLSALGIKYDENGVLQSVSSPLSLSLFGVRYLLTHEPIETHIKTAKRLRNTATDTPPTYDSPASVPDSLASLFSLVYRDETVTVYENDYYLPAVFRAAAIPDASLLSEANVSPYLLVNEIFRILTGDQTLSLYRPAEISSQSKLYCSVSDTVTCEGYTVYEESLRNGRAALVYTVTMQNDGPLFCSFPTQFPRKSASISVNDVSVGPGYKEVETEFLDAAGKPIVELSLGSYWLGDFKAGDTVTVTLSFGSDPNVNLYYLPNDTDFIFEIDRNAVEEAFSLLSSGGGSITASGDRIVASPDENALPAVVSTLASSETRVSSGSDGSAFLGVFVAQTSEQAQKAVFTPALSGGLPYLFSILGCLFLFGIVFLESFAACGARIPFFRKTSDGDEIEDEP